MYNCIIYVYLIFWPHVHPTIVFGYQNTENLIFVTTIFVTLYLYFTVTESLNDVYDYIRNDLFHLMLLNQLVSKVIIS